MSKQRVIILKSKPEGIPTHENFSFEERKLPDIGSNQVLLKTLYLSVDPYMRGKIAGTSSYTKPYKLNEPLYGDGLAEVLESKSNKFKKGDHIVSSEMPWSDISLVSADILKPQPKVDDEAALSVCGMTGQTAFIGLEKIGQPKQGDTCVVSGASGAVGGLVCQLLKNKGCKVIGIAGGKEKVEFLKKLGVDGTIDYKSEDLEKSIKQQCPDGVNFYWDNVGGETLDVLFKNMATHGTIVHCGAISQYNEKDPPKGPRNEIWLVDKRLRCQGFIVFDFKAELDEAVENMAKMYNSGKLKREVTVHNGLDNVPASFIDLFHGKNMGKMLVKL